MLCSTSLSKESLGAIDAPFAEERPRGVLVVLRAGDTDVFRRAIKQISGRYVDQLTSVKSCRAPEHRQPLKYKYLQC